MRNPRIIIAGLAVAAVAAVGGVTAASAGSSPASSAPSAGQRAAGTPSSTVTVTPAAHDRL